MEIRRTDPAGSRFAGVHLEEIIKAATWKTPTSFVACYLADTAEGTFARAALRAPRREAQNPPPS